MRRFPATRMRRNRTDDFVRRLVRENELTVNDLIYPMFVIAGANKQTDVESMPGISRYSVDLLVDAAAEVAELGVPAVALFPNVDAGKRSLDGAEAYNPDGLVPLAVSAIKAALPGARRHHGRRPRSVHEPRPGRAHRRDRLRHATTRPSKLCRSKPPATPRPAPTSSRRRT